MEKQELNYGIMPGETWRHYKGGNYKIITLANHSETKEPLVINQYHLDQFMQDHYLCGMKQLKIQEVVLKQDLLE